jgi:hypothetical protein
MQSAFYQGVGIAMNAQDLGNESWVRGNVNIVSPIFRDTGSRYVVKRFHCSVGNAARIQFLPSKSLDCGYITIERDPLQKFQTPKAEIFKVVVASVGIPSCGHSGGVCYLPGRVALGVH